MEQILVTGGCGFIGRNFINHYLTTTQNCEIINVDKLTYAGHLSNIEEFRKDSRFSNYIIDITDYEKIKSIFSENNIKYIINFAAETHVDRSINDPSIFLETNIFGTHNLANLALDYGIEKFIQVSTDEVYGSLQKDEESFVEGNPLIPNNPYSASKACADLLLHSYYKTYKLPCIITRCSNNYGPFQYPEKLIPVVINNAINGNEIPMYGTGENIRDWIFVSDHCRGIYQALKSGKVGEIYNFGGGTELTNLTLVKEILKILHKPENLIKFVPDRKGHDFRYSMDYSKAEKELDWKPKIGIDEGLGITVNWYLENTSWIAKVLQDKI